MLISANTLAKRFQMSRATLYGIFEKKKIRPFTLSGKRANGSDGYYEEGEVLPVLRKYKRRRHTSSKF